MQLVIFTNWKQDGVNNLLKLFSGGIHLESNFGATNPCTVDIRNENKISSGNMPHVMLSMSY